MASLRGYWLSAMNGMNGMTMARRQVLGCFARVAILALVATPGLGGRARRGGEFPLSLPAPLALLVACSARDATSGKDRRRGGIIPRPPVLGGGRSRVLVRGGWAPAGDLGAAWRPLADRGPGGPMARVRPGALVGLGLVSPRWDCWPGFVLLLGTRLALGPRGGFLPLFVPQGRGSLLPQAS